MKEVRIYEPQAFFVGETVALSPQASQHVGVVLRMKPGEVLTLFCGDNRECLARIVEVKKKQVFVLIDSVKEISRESSLQVHLAQAISKGDRMDFVMQKAVELGVASITPIISQRCVVSLDKERLAKKLQQWQAIVISSCEQSGRNKVPVVHQPLYIDQYLKQSNAALKLVLNPKATNSWRDYEPMPKDITVLIGPEGGLNQEEIDAALAQGFHGLSLGPRILRTETAAITALSVLQALAGDL